MYSGHHRHHSESSIIANGQSLSHGSSHVVPRYAENFDDSFGSHLGPIGHYVPHSLPVEGLDAPVPAHGQDSDQSNALPVAKVLMKKGSCKVCGEKAFYNFYGSLSCDSCRTFFRRHVLQNKELSCGLSGCCEVTARTRKECTKCRLNKCLLVGMRVELVAPNEQQRIRRGRSIDFEKLATRARVFVTSGQDTEEASRPSPEQPRPAAMSTSPPSPPDTEEIQVIESRGVHLTKAMMAIDAPATVEPLTPQSADRSADMVADNVFLFDSDSLGPLSQRNHVKGFVRRHRRHTDVGASASDDLLRSRMASSSRENLQCLGKQASEKDESACEGSAGLFSGFRTVQTPHELNPWPGVGGSNPPAHPSTTTLAPVESQSMTQRLRQNSCLRHAGSVAGNLSSVTTSSGQSRLVIGSLLTSSGDYCHHLARASSLELSENCHQGSTSGGHPSAEQSYEWFDRQHQRQAATRSAFLFEHRTMSTLEDGQESRPVVLIEHYPVLRHILQNPLDKALLGELVSVAETFVSRPVCVAHVHQKKHEMVCAVKLLYFGVEVVVRACQGMTPFRMLGEGDQAALLRGSCSEMLLIRSIFHCSLDKECWEFPGRGVRGENTQSHFKLNVLKTVSETMYTNYVNFVKAFDERWRSDNVVLTILTAIVLFSPNRSDLVDCEAIKTNQRCYRLILWRYLESLDGPAKAAALFFRLNGNLDQLKLLRKDYESATFNLSETDIILLHGCFGELYI